MGYQNAVATTESPPTPSLSFYALNTGYKDDNSANNYDFFALKKSDDSDLDLSPYVIQYFNSNDKLAGQIEFQNPSSLRSEILVFGYIKSPQYQNAPAEYQYTFSSSGLASTAGRLKLLLDGEPVDEICWGKIECAASAPKISTAPEENRTAVRCYGCEDGFTAEQYYPEITEAISHESHEEPICQNLRITEIYAYYEEDSSERFVEIFNPSAETELDSCVLRYKSKDYPLSGQLAENAYTIIQGVPLTKNPNTANELSLIDNTGVTIDTANYGHGQKKGVSLSLIDGEWLQTYARTPGAENIYQEFQTCPEGKVINELTGNCVNETIVTETVCPEGKYLNPETNRCRNVESAKTQEPCKEGYYRNPETGRCKKLAAEAAQTPCPDGYERNPETNRCRKIRTADASSYPVESIDEQSYDNPKIFIATLALVALGLLVLAYVVFQFRYEIYHFFRRHFINKTRHAKL